jgi:hypothetical protein
MYVNQLVPNYSLGIVWSSTEFLILKHTHIFYKHSKDYAHMSYKLQVFAVEFLLKLSYYQTL